MNEEQLKLIEENIAEVISGNILLTSDGARIAAVVMERLEVQGLMVESTPGLSGNVFTLDGHTWTQDELEKILFVK